MAVRVWPWSRLRELESRGRALESLLREHHNVGVVHERCGVTATAAAWGELCPVCEKHIVRPASSGATEVGE